MTMGNQKTDPSLCFFPVVVTWGELKLHHHSYQRNNHRYHGYRLSVVVGVKALGNEMNVRPSIKGISPLEDGKQNEKGSRMKDHRKKKIKKRLARKAFERNYF